MPREDKKTWKKNYFTKVTTLLDEFPKCFVVGADNVSSKQMQMIRRSMRGKAEILMGKNTMMRRAINMHLSENPNLEKLLPHLRGNVGIVCTKEDLIEIRDSILDNKVEAPARANAISPIDVFVPAQNTGLGPEKTSFFQALSIQTKISRGSIEITNKVHLLHPGDKVTASDATLLNLLNISPFTYGLEVKQVYDNGTCFHPDVLDITEDDMKAKFMAGIQDIAALSLAIGVPTTASVPHSIINGFKDLLAIAAVTEITFPEAESMKAYLADPSAFAVAAAPVEAAAEVVEAKEESEEEESSGDMGMDLFG